MNIKKFAQNVGTNVSNVIMEMNVQNVLKEDHYQTVIALQINMTINRMIQIVMIVMSNVNYVQVRKTIAISVQETE